MAAGVGMHTGAVHSIQEDVSSGVTPVTAVPGSSQTPVLPGLVYIQATVTLEVGLTP